MRTAATGTEFRIWRWRFRPRLGPTLMTIPALIVLLALGTWQLERLEWKEGLIAERTSRAAAPAIAPPGADADLSELEFRPVRLRGRFLNDQEMFLAARSMNGNVGYHVVTPFLLENGAAVLVDRGWIPLDRKDASARSEGEIAGGTEVVGLIREGGRTGWFTPDNRPGENFWFYVDVPAMAAHAGLAQSLPYFVEAGPAENPGGLPIGGQTRLKLRNDHLQYAVTWYLLALALVVIYLIYHRVRPE